MEWKPEWIAAIFLGVKVAAAALRGTITEPGMWIAAILGVVVLYVVFAFVYGDDGRGTATRKERLSRFTLTRPWRAGAVAAASLFAVWIVLSPLFDRPYTAAFWGLAFGSAALVFAFYVGVAHLARWQQR